MTEDSLPSPDFRPVRSVLTGVLGTHSDGSRRRRDGRRLDAVAIDVMLDRWKRCRQFATRYFSTQQVGCRIAESAEKHTEPVVGVEGRFGRYSMQGLPRDGEICSRLRLVKESRTSRSCNLFSG